MTSGRPGDPARILTTCALLLCVVSVSGLPGAGPLGSTPALALTALRAGTASPQPWPPCPANALPFAGSAPTAMGKPAATSAAGLPTAGSATAGSSSGDVWPSPTSTVGGSRLSQAGAQVDPGPAPTPSGVSAYLVADTETGRVLASCNAHVRLAPASTLKLLTALALIDRVPADAKYVATPAAASVDGTRVGLVPGLTYSGSDLWHGLLMSSGNDCAVALGELAGGEPAAVATLNQTARRLGAADTLAVNDSGLDAPGQVSSAYDLALFARAALGNKQILALAQTRSYSFPGSPASATPSTRGGHPSLGSASTASSGSTPRSSFQIQNHNRLLYNYPGATGLKNGYTVAAGGSFVGTATRTGHSYLAVVLRSDANTWRASAALLDWAFAHPDAQAVGTLDAPPIPDPSPAGTAPSGPGLAVVSGVGPTGAAGSPSVGSSGAAQASGVTGWVWAVGGVLLLTAVGASGALVRRRRGARTGQAPTERSDPGPR